MGFDKFITFQLIKSRKDKLSRVWSASF